MAFIKCPKCGSVSNVTLADGIQKPEITENDDIPEIMCLSCFRESLDEEHLDIWGPLIRTVIILGTIVALGYIYIFVHRVIYGG